MTEHNRLYKIVLMFVYYKLLYKSNITEILSHLLCSLLHFSLINQYIQWSKNISRYYIDIILYDFLYHIYDKAYKILTITRTKL